MNVRQEEFEAKLFPTQPVRRAGRTWLVASFFALGGGALVFWHFSPGAAETYETAVATRGVIEDAITALGKIQPRAYVDVGAQASGRLDRLPVIVGQNVSAGQLLAEIDPQFQSAKIQAIKADIARLNANLVEQEAQVALAELRLARQAKLLPNNATSQSTFDEANFNAQTAKARASAIRAQVQQMEETLKAEEVLLSYTKVYAPMAGTIVSVDAREGQTLNATYSTPLLLRIADLTVMTVWTQVSEADVPRLKEGMEVRFTTLGHIGRTWSGRLRKVLPAPPRLVNSTGTTEAGATAQPGQSNVVLYTALFDVDNAAGELRPEMSAQVSFVAGRADDAVLIPSSALSVSKRLAGGVDGVFVQVLQADGKTEERAIETGIKTRFQVQVKSGLREGEKVVTIPRDEAPRTPLIKIGL